MRTFPISATALLAFALNAAFVQTNNVRVTNNAYEQSETAIAISPTNPNLVLASWNDRRRDPNGLTVTKPGYAFFNRWWKQLVA